MDRTSPELLHVLRLCAEHGAQDTDVPKITDLGLLITQMAREVGASDRITYIVCQTLADFLRPHVAPVAVSTEIH